MKGSNVTCRCNLNPRHAHDKGPLHGWCPGGKERRRKKRPFSFVSCSFSGVESLVFTLLIVQSKPVDCVVVSDSFLPRLDLVVGRQSPPLTKEMEIRRSTTSLIPTLSLEPARRQEQSQRLRLPPPPASINTKNTVQGYQQQ